MGITYSLIAGILLYFLAVKLVVSEQLSARGASLLAVAGSFVVWAIEQAILSAASDTSFVQLLSFALIVKIVLQFAVAYVIFYAIIRGGESYFAWVGWSLFGFILIFLVVPRIVS